MLPKNGIIPLNASYGPSPVLSKDYEDEILRWLLYCSDWCFPVTKTQLITCVSSYIKNRNIKNPFIDNVPGRAWYKAFLRRHSQLSARVAQNLMHNRASITEGMRRKWFSEVQTHLEEKNLKDISSSRVFSCDETAFYLCPKSDRVWKGDKAVYNFVHNDEKECLTTL